METTLIARLAALEQRVADLEDELGVTDRAEARAARDALVALYLEHGFSKTSARKLAHADIRRGVALPEARESIRRKRGTGAGPGPR
jgi:hypothetical protein